MRFVIIAIGVLLAGCAARNPPTLDFSILEERKAKQEIDLLQKAMKDKIPIQDSQILLAAHTVIFYCAKKRTATVNIEDFDKIQAECAEELIAQTLILGGSDRAYATQLMVKRIYPGWEGETIIPSYVDVE